VRPAPIPDSAVWPDAERIVVAPPDGDLTNSDIAPVEALVDRVEMSGTSGRRLSVRCVLEDGDLGKLEAGAAVWISFYGVMVPFSVDVQ
jgi:hypothetical protein